MGAYFKSGVRERERERGKSTKSVRVSSSEVNLAYFIGGVICSNPISQLAKPGDPHNGNEWSLPVAACRLRGQIPDTLESQNGS